MDKMSEASLLKLDTAIVTGIRYTESGREKISKKARNILRLIIEYTIPENKFTDPGVYVLYVQIINPNNENIFKIKQIAGFVARRIVNHMKPNLGTYQGQKFGFIRFGSRVEIIVPNNFDIKVQKGMKVKGCKTIIGEFT